MTRAATVYWGQKPQHFTYHREANGIQGLTQLVVARDYSILNVCLGAEIETFDMSSSCKCISP